MGKRIILVDDDQDFCEILKSRLEKEGFTVEVAYDGEQGLEKVRSNPPDLLILDVMMPKKSGLEVCKELKADSAYNEIPIIMLTAVAEHIGETTYTQYDAMGMEAEDYIPKGPDCTEKVVKSVLEIISKD
ncbi:response regulator transcription factor [Desulfothermus sp.]